MLKMAHLVSITVEFRKKLGLRVLVVPELGPVKNGRITEIC